MTLPDMAVERRAMQLAVTHARAAQPMMVGMDKKNPAKELEVSVMSLADLRREFCARLLSSGSLPVLMHMINRGGLLPPTDERQRALAAILQVWDGDAQPPQPLPQALMSVPAFEMGFLSIQIRHVFPAADLSRLNERQLRGAFDGLILRTGLLPIAPGHQDRISAVSLSLMLESAQGDLVGAPGQRLGMASPRAHNAKGGAGTPRSPRGTKLDRKDNLAMPLPVDGAFDDFAAAPLRSGQMEIELWKSPMDAERSWGIVLCFPADVAEQGLVVSELDPDGLIVWKGFPLEPGDVVHAIDGTPLTLLAQANDRLTGSYAKLVISKAKPLPRGWVKKIDKENGNRPYFIHGQSLVATYSHPAGRVAQWQKENANSPDADPNPPDDFIASPNGKGVPALAIEKASPSTPLANVLAELPAVILTEPFHEDFLRLNLRHALPMANVYMSRPEQLRGAFDQLLVRAGLLPTATANQEAVKSFLAEQDLSVPEPPPLSARVMEKLIPPRLQQHTIKISKLRKESTWGMTLTRPADGGPGVVVSELDPLGLAMKSNALAAGDRIDAIDGIEITSRAEACDALREVTQGAVVFTITRCRGLPDGWVQRKHKESGRSYYVYKKARIATFAHPWGRAAHFEVESQLGGGMQDLDGRPDAGGGTYDDEEADWMQAVRPPPATEMKINKVSEEEEPVAAAEEVAAEVDEGVDEVVKATNWKKMRQAQLREADHMKGDEDEDSESAWKDRDRPPKRLSSVEDRRASLRKSNTQVITC